MQHVNLADISFASTSKQWNEVFAEGKQGGMPKKFCPRGASILQNCHENFVKATDC
jgi:hypothetical protein